MAVLSLVASRHWPIHQLDVKNAFLHDDLSKIVYMHQPPGFQDSVHPDYGTDTAYLLLYVDDNVLTASSKILLQVFLSQKKYAVEILDRAHMLNCNPSRTPIDTESKLRSDGDLVSEPTLYRSLVGSLQYLTFTRPDISYAVQQVCLYMHDPREPHFASLKRILRYVRGTLDYGLQLFSSSTTDLVAYSDADWAGCPTTRRSASGYCVFLGNNLLSWSSKCQPTLSCSSAEAKYRGVANAVAETCWLRNLLRELHTPLTSATLVFCDNVSAVYLSCNPIQHQRTKHIDIDIHFVRDLVAVGQVRVLHVPSCYQFADIFTKGLPSALFEEFRFSLSVRYPPAPTAREYAVSVNLTWLGGCVRSIPENHRGTNAKKTAALKTDVYKKAHSALLLCLDNKVLKEVNKEDSAAGVWLNLETLYITKSLANKLYLKKKLFTFYMHSGKKLSEHIDEFNKLIGDLANTDVDIDDEDRALMLLTSLPSLYDNFVETLLYEKKSLTLEDVLSSLNSRELKKRTDAKDDGDGLYVRGRSDHKGNQGRSSSQSKLKGKGTYKLKCYIFYSEDHLKKDCPKRNKKKSIGFVKKNVEQGSSIHSESYDNGDLLMT
ncbi:ribonuclease H-like domain-containing protein, partial [Tanacetum coccineum]